MTQTTNTIIGEVKKQYARTDSILIYQGQKAKDANSKCWKLMLSYADEDKKPGFINDVVAFKTTTGGFRIVKSQNQNQGITFDAAMAHLAK